MGNCLVTKLKGVVNNDNLLKVGEFRFGIAGTEKTIHQISVASGIAELSILDAYPNVVFTQNNQRTREVPTSRITATVSDDCIVSLDDKYKLSCWYSNGNVDITCDLNELSYSPLAVLIMYSGLDGSIGNISGLFSKLPSTLTQLTLYSKNVIFDAFPALPNISEFEAQINEALDINDIVRNYPTLSRIFGFYGNVKGNIETLPTRTNMAILRLERRSLNSWHEVSGDIASLATWVGLTTLNISGTKISGSIAAFLNAMYNNGAGRTSGSITITVNSTVTNVTGAESTQKYDFSSGGWTMA